MICARPLTAHTDIKEFDPSAWRSIIGVVPQDPILFRGTIAENIAYGAPDTPREEIERAARAANCEFVWGMPQGFDTISACTLPTSVALLTRAQSAGCPSRAASASDSRSRARC